MQTTALESRCGKCAGYVALTIFLATTMPRAAGEDISVRIEKSVAVLNKLDATTMFGRTKFSTEPKEHGMQLTHAMVVGQWQKKGGQLVKEVIWPNEAKTADILY